VKLRAHTETPAFGAEGTQFLTAGGAKQEAHHGPLQRLLEYLRLRLTLAVREADDKSIPPRV
jgi:hypothetical protein